MGDFVRVSGDVDELLSLVTDDIERRLGAVPATQRRRREPGGRATPRAWPASGRKTAARECPSRMPRS